MSKINKKIIDISFLELRRLKQSEVEFKEKLKNKKEEIKKRFTEDNFKNYLKELSYQSAKELLEKARYVLDYKEYEEMKNGILKEIKLRDYPVLKDAYHFPILNEIEFLSKDNIKILDKYLSNPRVNMLSNASIYRELKDIAYNTELETIRFLLGKNIIEEIYSINCPYCSNEVESLYKEEYKELKENIDKGDIWEDICDECNQDVSIESLEELKRCADINYYKIIAEPINIELDEI